MDRCALMLPLLLARKVKEMESWSTIRYRLAKLHCPLLENLDDRKISADLSGLTGDLRYNLLEWLFLTYDTPFYEKFITSDQSDSGRVQREYSVHLRLDGPGTLGRTLSCLRHLLD